MMNFRHNVAQGKDSRLDGRLLIAERKKNRGEIEPLFLSAVSNQKKHHCFPSDRSKVAANAGHIHGYSIQAAAQP